MHRYLQPFVLFIIFLSTQAHAAWPTGAPASAPALPAFPAGKIFEKGVKSYEITLNRAGTSMRICFYLPDPIPKENFPYVFVAPAGTRLFHGMKYGDGDEKEVTPYVHAGFGGVSYDVDGDLPAHFTDPQALVAAKAFMDSHSGVDNAKAAIDYAIAKAPGIDIKKLYSAGHSSAATISLLVASHEPRIVAAVAYAPCTDVSTRLKTLLPLFEKSVPGFTDFVKDYSPINCLSGFKCPIFIFHAKDDSNVQFSESQAFVAAAQRAKLQVTFTPVATGNHYDSMIQQGIPAGIKWLQALP